MQWLKSEAARGNDFDTYKYGAFSNQTKVVRFCNLAIYVRSLARMRRKNATEGTWLYSGVCHLHLKAAMKKLF